jgi:methionine-gamma-lyase
MTHCGVDDGVKNHIGITEKLVRLSVGVEDPEDLIWDIDQALKHVEFTGDVRIPAIEGQGVKG